MRCPFCKEDNDKVVDSRASGAGAIIRRRRECLECGKRYTTYERLEEAPLRVIKKDGSRVEYDREKVLAGIHRACEKRPVSEETIENIVRSLEEAINREFDREVPSNFMASR